MLLSVASVVGITIDVLVIGLIVIFALIGLKKGFFKSVLSMISTLVVIIVSIVFAGTLAKLINKIYNFNGLIAKKLCKNIAGMDEFYRQPIPPDVSGEALANSIPPSTNNFLEKIMSHVLKPLSASDIEGLTVAEIVSGAFASIIMTIIAGILLFILIKIVLALASKLFDNITKNRVFGGVNKLFGFVFGGLKGLIIVALFSVVLTLLTVIPVVNTKISPIIYDNTKVARPIYKFTDDLMEKYVVDGKLVQKWVDNLWENKYKGKGDDEVVPTTNGTLQNPHIINLYEDNGSIVAHLNIAFNDTNTIQYYKLDASDKFSTTFDLSIDVVEVNWFLYNINDTDTQISYTDLDQTQQYIIKFEREASSSVTNATAILNLTNN